MKAISAGDILRQLKADLIGKDSYRGVTLTYSWLANQFGHFSLGFIPTFILYIYFREHTSIYEKELWAAVIISAAWLAFESYNFLGPLLLKRRSGSNLVFTGGAKYNFHPAWGNIAFDTFTDLCFFWLGAFFASRLLLYCPITVNVLIALVLILIYPVYYWFTTKMYLQAAQYPFQFRLSQWDLSISEANKEIVNQYIKTKEQGKHLFVFGSEGNGKTSLGVAVATEMSILRHTCLYTTAIKLCSMFFEGSKKELADKKMLWSWRDTSVLVIDDINPGDPIKKDILTPDDFLKFLDTLSPENDDNREIIRDKNIIWVLGNDDSKAKGLTWKEMLEKIGVKEEDILTVDLV